MADTLDAQAAIRAWFDHLRAERRARPKTLEAYSRDINQFMDFLTGHLGGPAGLDALESLAPADFRAWLTDLANRHPEPGGSPVEVGPDLHTLLGQMMAVRQEVTLQTRAVRAQTEQNAQALEILDDAGAGHERCCCEAARWICSRVGRVVRIAVGA